jgi:hypothetical protein
MTRWKFHKIMDERIINPKMWMKSIDKDELDGWWVHNLRFKVGWVKNEIWMNKYGWTFRVFHFITWQAKYGPNIMNEDYCQVLFLHKYLGQSLLISCGDLQSQTFFSFGMGIIPKNAWSMKKINWTLDNPKISIDIMFFGMKFILHFNRPRKFLSITRLSQNYKFMHGYWTSFMCIAFMCKIDHYKNPFLFPKYFQLGEEINISNPITRCYQCNLISTFGLNE